MGASMQSKGRVGKAGGRSRAYRPMSEINVTPFVDVMLVLLVVFMITAPLLTAGVDINLPRSDANPITDEDNKPLEVSITDKGVIYIGETEVQRDRLVNLLTAMTNNDPDRRIFIRADQTLNYGNVMDILGTLNKAGFRKVALLSNPAK
ncbi:MAG: protein TolR [Rhodospirillales bacterium]|nr:protein TolR [Rhodospirillales bacterium]MCB9995722.1 protein TolR [Rhodospirillales bacterium]